jgi:hypothetical protein
MKWTKEIAREPEEMFRLDIAMNEMDVLSSLLDMAEKFDLCARNAFTTFLSLRCQGIAFESFESKDTIFVGISL